MTQTADAPLDTATADQTAPDSAPADRRRDYLGVLVLLALVSFLVSLRFIMAVPPLWGPDERAHAAYAVELLDGKLPTVDTPVKDQPERFPQISDTLHAETVEARTHIWVANHPPLFYLISAPFLALGDYLGVPVLGFTAMRLFNALGAALCVILVGLLAREIVPRRPVVPVLAAALAASHTSISYLAGLGYNDGFANAAASAALLCGVRMVRHGPNRKLLLWATLFGAAAASLRVPGVVAVLAVTVLTLAAIWLHASPDRRIWRALGGAALVSGVPFLAAGWFYIRNIVLYGDATASKYLLAKFQREAFDSVWEVALAADWYRRLFENLWIRRVAPHGELYRWVPDILLMLVGLGLLLMLAQWLRRRRNPAVAAERAVAPLGQGATASAVIWLTLLGHAAVNVASLVQHRAGGGNAHIRYLQPVVPILMTITALALLHLVSYLPARHAYRRDLLAAVGIGSVMMLFGLVTQRGSMWFVGLQYTSKGGTVPFMSIPASRVFLVLAGLVVIGFALHQARRLRVTPPG